LLAHCGNSWRCSRMPAMEVKRTVGGRGRHRRAWPDDDLAAVVARAQQPALPVVGFLDAGPADASARYVAAFRKGGE
jgi:hypothetical protein